MFPASRAAVPIQAGAYPRAICWDRNAVTPHGVSLQHPFTLAWPPFLLVGMHCPIPKAAAGTLRIEPKPAFLETLVHTQASRSDDLLPPPKIALSNFVDEIPPGVGRALAMALGPGASGGNILGNVPFIDHLPSLSHCLSPTGVSWGHLPNKLLVLKSSRHGVLLGDPRPRQHRRV